MIRLPNIPRMPNIRNRSSKHLFNLTRRGIKQMIAFQEKMGIKLEKRPKKAKKAEATPTEAK